MTGVGGAPKDFSAFIAWTKIKITALERRQIPPFPTPVPYVLPDRVGPEGQEVSDWNDAIETGFYWSTTGGLNRPGGVSFVTGYVLRNLQAGFERIIQKVWVPSSPGIIAEWSRLGHTPVAGVYSWTEWRRTDGTMQVGVSQSGGTFDAVRGRINLTVGAKELVVANCFVTDWDKYRIDYNISTPSDNNRLNLVLRSGGADVGTAGWQQESIYAAGSGTPGAFELNNNAYYPLSIQELPNNHGWFEIDNPRTQVSTALKTVVSINGGNNLSGGVAFANVTTASGCDNGVEGTAVDGFALRLNVPARAGFGAGSWVRIRGIGQ